MRQGRASTQFAGEPKSYGWSRDRCLHVLLSLEAIQDIEDGRSSRSMLDHIDASLAIMPPAKKEEGGHSCAMKLTLHVVQRMIMRGGASRITEN